MTKLLEQVKAMLAELEAALKALDESTPDVYSNISFRDIEQYLETIESWVNQRQDILATDRDVLAELIIQKELNSFYRRANPTVKQQINARLNQLYSIIRAQ